MVFDQLDYHADNVKTTLVGYDLVFEPSPSLKATAKSKRNSPDIHLIKIMHKCDLVAYYRRVDYYGDMPTIYGHIIVGCVRCDYSKIIVNEELEKMFLFYAKLMS